MAPIALIRVQPDDNVAVATRQIERGETVRTAEGDEVTATDQARYGWKVAVAAIAEGDDIVKYGEKIGTASTPIAPGDPVHTHNVTPLPIPDVYVDGT